MIHPINGYGYPRPITPPMTPDEVLALAKEGNPKILTAIMNRSTQSHGIRVRVAQKQGCLHILLEGEAIANSASLVTFVEGSLSKLNVNPDLPVRVYGRQQGQKSIAWSQNLHRQNHQQPSGMPNSPNDAYPPVTVNSSSDDFSSNTSFSSESQMDGSVPSRDGALPDHAASSQPAEPALSKVPEHSTEPSGSSVPQNEAASTSSPTPPPDPWDIDPWSPSTETTATEAAATEAATTEAATTEAATTEAATTEATASASTQPEVSQPVSLRAESPLPESPSSESPQPEPSPSSSFEPESASDESAPLSPDQSLSEAPPTASSQAELPPTPQTASFPSESSQFDPSIPAYGGTETEIVNPVEPESSALSGEEVSEEDEGVSDDALATTGQPNTMGAFASGQPAEANSASEAVDSSMEINTPDMVDTPIPDEDLFEEQEETFNFQAMMQRPEALVILLFAIVLYIWQIYTALATKAAPEGSVSGQELAERLGVSRSTISRRKFDPDFAEWSSSQDPDGIAWAFEGGAFVPQMPDFTTN